MNKPQDILIILTPGFAANEQDTTCLPFLQNLVRAYNNSYPELKIIIIAFQYPFHKGTYDWHNNQVLSFNGRNRSKLYRLNLWRQVWTKLKRLRNENNIIGMLSLWATECALVGKYFGARYNIKHYTWLCGQDARKENKYIRLIKPNASSLIAMSDFLKDTFYANHGVSPEHVIPVGIIPEDYTGNKPEKDIDILGVGALIPLKQYDVFINVIKYTTNYFPNVKGMVCGEGPEKQNLEIKIQKLKIQNNVALTGAKAHNEILKLMQRSKIFLHTSSYEGFGTVCLEALYAGAHVISFTKPMKQDIPHWHIVSTLDEMYEKVLELLRSENNYEPVCFFTMTQVAEKMMSLFR